LACTFVDKEGFFGKKGQEFILISTNYPAYNIPVEIAASLVHEIGATSKFNLSHFENEARELSFKNWQNLKLSLKRIDLAFEYVETGKYHWDKVLVLVSQQDISSKAKASLEYHFKELSHLYRHTDIEILVSPPKMGNFDAPLWAIRELINQGLNPTAKVLILLAKGRSTRSFPLGATLGGGKGEISLPHSYKGHLLELIDQVYIQSHMLLEDIPEGSFCIFTNDQIWALGEPLKFSSQEGGVKVFASRYDMRPVEKELVELNWIYPRHSSFEEVKVKGSGEEEE
jgi:hypothetical protein